MAIPVAQDDIDNLIQSLYDENYQLRMFIMGLIVDHSQKAKAIPHLIEKLKDEHPEVRSRGAWALGKIKDQSAVTALIESLNDNEWEVRKSVLRALAEIGSKEIIEIIVGKMKDKHSSVRSEAAIVLEELKWFPTNKYEEALFHLCKGHWKEFVTIGHESVLVALDFMNDQNKEVKIKLAESLGEIGQEIGVQPLFDLLMLDLDPDVKKSAALSLAQIRNETANDLLLVGLNDENWMVRMFSATGLGKTKNRSVLQILKEHLNDENLYVRKSVEKAILELEDDK